MGKATEANIMNSYRKAFNVLSISLMASWCFGAYQFLPDYPLLFSDVSGTISLAAFAAVIFNRLFLGPIISTVVVLLSCTLIGLSKGYPLIGNLDDICVIFLIGMYWRYSQVKRLSGEMRLAVLEEKTRLMSDVLEHDITNQLLALNMSWDLHKKELGNIGNKNEGDNLNLSIFRTDGILDSMRNVLNHANRKKKSIEKRQTNVVEKLVTLSGFEMMAKQHLSTFTSVRNQQLILNCKSDLDVIYCDPNVIIFQIMANLVNNASKYSDEGTQILVDVVYSRGELKIRVTDHGKGIVKFNKDGLPARNQAKNSGTGSGLRLTKAYIDEMNGQLSFSTSTSGTVVSVNI